MLVASELKGELARIQPARACCRRAELSGLLHVTAPAPRAAAGKSRTEIRTLDHATARTAMHLAASLGIAVEAPAMATPSPAAGRRHLRVRIDATNLARWSWRSAAPCDRRAFLRGVVLAGGSISLTAHGAHVEFVVRSAARAAELRRRLRELGVHAGILERRRRHVVYLKGHEEIAELLRLVGANRGLLELETIRVAREVRNRLNRLLNAEEANLGRTVRAADRQLQAIDRLEAAGLLDRLPLGLRETAIQRRRQPDADLDTLADALGVSRSAVNHRLRRLVDISAELAEPTRGGA